MLGLSQIFDNLEVLFIIGCYKKNVTYIDGSTREQIPLSQIVSLIQLSDYCDQGFYYKCKLAPLQDEDIDFAFWTDRHGEQNVYFTGKIFLFFIKI